jgi:hypothetical protein
MTFKIISNPISHFINDQLLYNKLFRDKKFPILRIVNNLIFQKIMFITVTSIELKTPFKFFTLAYLAMQIIKQLKSTPCIKYKSNGFWTKHYTLYAWENMEDIKAFYKSGEHLSAMQQSAVIAKCIQTYTAWAKQSYPERIWLTNHNLVQFFGGIRITDTNRVRSMRQADIINAPVGSIILWDTHYGFRPEYKMDVAYDYFEKHSSSFKLLQQFNSEDNRFVCLAFEKTGEVASP